MTQIWNKTGRKYLSIIIQTSCLLSPTGSPWLSHILSYRIVVSVSWILALVVTAVCTGNLVASLSTKKCTFIKSFQNILINLFVALPLFNFWVSISNYVSVKPPFNTMEEFLAQDEIKPLIPRNGIVNSFLKVIICYLK